MKNALKKDCLVLNRSWIPCNTVKIKRAVNMAIKNRGKIIHPKTLNMYSFEEWVNKGHELEVHETLTHKGKRYDIPTIICAIYYNDLHVKYIALNHQNIYKRDNFTCAYCGSSSNLTWDHIIPECRKGKTSWTNLVTACRRCNNEKDNMDVEEFCQIKKCKIPKPVSLATTPWLLEKFNLRTEWKKFLKGGG
ncbi:MAG: HNH endonuclease [bacterium]